MSKSKTGRGAAVGKVPSGCYVRYDTSHRKRGTALIISNTKFSRGRKMAAAVYQLDEDALSKTFGRLGFKTVILSNLSAREMETAMHRAAREDHSDADCFVCVIMSRGAENDAIYGTDREVNLEDLMAPFKGDMCPSLAGKPKFFFIQASRGAERDAGRVVTSGGNTEEFDASPYDDDDDAVTHVIPSEADFLVAHSTAKGYVSFANNKKGSWFIQSLCQVLDDAEEQDEIHHLLLRVNRKVAYEYQSVNRRTPELEGLKQIPSFTSQLTREFYFTKK